MIVLNENNEFVNTDSVNEPFFFSVLSFENYKEPDFMFRETSHLIHYNTAGIALELSTKKRSWKIIVPLHWWILLADMDEVQTIPLYELSRPDYEVFCYNPINGYRPEHLTMRVAESPSIYPHANWTSPPVAEKDLILIPVGIDPDAKVNLKGERQGPLCAIFSTNKFEVSRSAADLWG